MVVEPNVAPVGAKTPMAIALLALPDSGVLEKTTYRVLVVDNVTLSVKSAIVTVSALMMVAATSGIIRIIRMDGTLCTGCPPFGL
jgi:hypothetical protein